MKNTMRLSTLASAALISLGLSGTGEAQQPPPQSPNMTFFVVTTGPGKGADLGGLEGADRQCQTLAQNAGAGSKTWRAYLSTQAADGKPAVNARDRIGAGPWQNFKGDVVAQNVDDLHSDNNKLGMPTSLTERGTVVAGRRLHPELSRRPHRLAGGRPGISGWRGQDLPELDEQHAGRGNGRPYRPKGSARRRRLQVLEFIASLARARGRLQPERSQRHWRQRPVLLFRLQLTGVSRGNLELKRCSACAAQDHPDPAHAAPHGRRAVSRSDLLAGRNPPTPRPITSLSRGVHRAACSAASA